MFPVALWNQYGTDSQMRTDNYVEPWNARFNRVRGARPDVYMFIARIKQEEYTVSTTLTQLRCRCAASKRRTKYDAVDRRDLRSFEIRFEFEAAVPIRFDGDGPIRKFSNRPCLPIARSSQTTQTINGA